jgi:hypothetical protein
MKWIFITPNLVTELDTELAIRLISGTWSNPIEIRPDKTMISIYDQARLLRLGLEFAIKANLINSEI